MKNNKRIHLTAEEAECIIYYIERFKPECVPAGVWEVYQNIKRQYENYADRARKAYDNSKTKE